MSGSELDLVVDALAGLLRDFGRHAFDLSRQDARRTQALFDQWAQHVVVGSEVPGKPGKAPTGGVGNRAFSELRNAFHQHRKTEQTEVTAAQDALRDVVWTFVASLNKVAREDQAEDSRLGQTLGSLVDAVEKVPTTEIRKLALQAVQAVQSSLEARKQRQARQIQDLSQKLESLGSQLEVARKESTSDALTQLFNRRAFDEQLARASEMASFKAGGAALILIDIDHFKYVNDTWGHPAGDAVLKAVAHACNRAFKRRNDFVARYGGEEIAALLSDLTESEAVAAAERCREDVAALKVQHEATVIKVTASFGVARFVPGEAADAWLARADAALYRAKHNGRNRVET